MFWTDCFGALSMFLYPGQPCHFSSTENDPLNITNKYEKKLCTYTSYSVYNTRYCCTWHIDRVDHCPAVAILHATRRMIFSGTILVYRSIPPPQSRTLPCPNRSRSIFGSLSHQHIIFRYTIQYFGRLSSGLEHNEG